MRLAVKILILILLAPCAFGGWTADIWPASNTSPRKSIGPYTVVITNLATIPTSVTTQTIKFAKDMWPIDCWRAISEKERLVTIPSWVRINHFLTNGYYTPNDGSYAPTWYRFEHANLLVLKQRWLAVASKFLDTRYIGTDEFASYLSSLGQYGSSVPLFSQASLASVGLPSNFVTTAMWRKINEDGTNGWDALRHAITSTVYTSTSASFSNLVDTTTYCYNQTEPIVVRSTNTGAIIFQTTGNKHEVEQEQHATCDESEYDSYTHSTQSLICASHVSTISSRGRCTYGNTSVVSQLSADVKIFQSWILTPTDSDVSWYEYEFCGDDCWMCQGTYGYPTPPYVGFSVVYPDPYHFDHTMADAPYLALVATATKPTGQQYAYFNNPLIPEYGPEPYVFEHTANGSGGPCYDWQSNTYWATAFRTDRWSLYPQYNKQVLTTLAIMKWTFEYQ